jgi:hypothetical protein
VNGIGCGKENPPLLVLWLLVGSVWWGATILVGYGLAVALIGMVLLLPVLVVAVIGWSLTGNFLLASVVFLVGVVTCICTGFCRDPPVCR